MSVTSIELFGKPLFNKVAIPHPLKLATPMREDEAAFVYVLQGGCINYTETEELKLTAGQAVLAKCGNSTFSTLKTEGEPEYQAIVVKFHKEVLEKLYENSPSPLLKKASHELKVNMAFVETTALIEQYVNSLIAYFENPGLVNEDLLRLKLNELLLLLLQGNNAPEVLGIMHHLFEKKTFEFKEVVKNHVCSSLSIEELAQLTNHSLSAFKRKFHQVFNDTPQRYIINQRIEKVAEILPVSNEPISNIAYDCEFKTLAHMSRVFKAKYGVSPSEYRLTFSDKR